MTIRFALWENRQSGTEGLNRVKAGRRVLGEKKILNKKEAGSLMLKRKGTASFSMSREC